MAAVFLSGSPEAGIEAISGLTILAAAADGDMEVDSMPLSRTPLLPACGLILLHGLAGGQERVWMRASLADLEMLTPGDAAQAAPALRELESLRSTLRETAPVFAGTGPGLTVVAFSTEWEYHEFRVNAHSPAYFVGGPGRCIVVLGRLAKETMPALRHEFIHYLIRSSGPKLPLWLEEGLADALSGLDPAEARRRVQLLRAGQRIGWPDLFRTAPGAALYQDWRMARLFYAQSWALVEALLDSSGGSLTAKELARWGESDIGADEKLEAAVAAFLRRSSPAASSPLAPARETVRVEPAPAGLVLMALGRLSAQTGDLERAGRRLRAAAYAWPEAWSALGDLEYKRGRPEKARAAYRQAMAAGVPDERILWRLAVLEQNLPDGDMAPALERILLLDPSQQEARLALASQYIHRGRWPEALAQLTTVRNAPPRWADFYRQALQTARARVSSFAGPAPD